jgi:hypothetical protein
MKPALLVWLGALVLVPAAGAQTPGANDPAPSSPPGVIYEIPLEQGRHDAAPRPPSSHRERGGTGTQGSPSGTVQPAQTPRSSIRSDNGFGSSTTVPGATATPQSKPRSTSGSRKGNSASTKARRTATATPTSAADQERRIVANTSSLGPSTSRAMLVLALAVLVAVGLGIGARRASRH